MRIIYILLLVLVAFAGDRSDAVLWSINSSVIPPSVGRQAGVSSLNYCCVCFFFLSCGPQPVGNCVDPSALCCSLSPFGEGRMPAGSPELRYLAVLIESSPAIIAAGWREALQLVSRHGGQQIEFAPFVSPFPVQCDVNLMCLSDTFLCFFRLKNEHRFSGKEHHSTHTYLTILYNAARPTQQCIQDSSKI